MNPAYKCSQQEFYAAAKLGWQNYRDNLLDFTNHKAKYTAAFGDDALNALLAAKNLPDDQARDSVSETLRVQLTQVADVCLADWQVLKSYILEAFAEEEQKTRLEAAGAKYYRKAANKGWTEMQALLDLATRFITD